MARRQNGEIYMIKYKEGTSQNARRHLEQFHSSRLRRATGWDSHAFTKAFR